MRINERVKELRIEYNLTQNEFASKLNCNRQKIADWEREKTTPSADDIILMAKTFGVTSDYLLGLVDNPSTDVRHIEITEITGLDDDAIEELASEFFAGWRDNNPFANETMSAFVSSGVFDELISKMVDYYDYQTEYINELNTIFQNAQEIYNRVGLDIVLYDEFKALSSVAKRSDSSINKQNMKLCLFDMAEIPKDFVKALFISSKHKLDDIFSRIEELDLEIRKKELVQRYSILEQIEQERKEKEGQQHGNDSEA